ncbi:MAG: hypothetical protein ACKOEM_00225, partial [Planctomycetia bacterium]
MDTHDPLPVIQLDPRPLRKSAGGPQQGRRFLAVLPWCLVICLAAINWVVLNREQPRSENPSSAQSGTPGSPVGSSSATHAASGKSPGPLEPWPDGQAAIEVLGYTNVRAFRWSGGDLSGWVDFDGEEKPRRESIELQDGLTQDAHPRRSGQIIIAEREVAGKKGVVECWVWARLETDFVLPDGTNAHGSTPLRHHGLCSVHLESDGLESDEPAGESQELRLLPAQSLVEGYSGSGASYWHAMP